MANQQVTVDTQRWGALLRQGLAVAGVVFGVLTSSVSSLHLPPSISSIMMVGGAVVLAVEHYVSDPSTGTPPPSSTTTTKTDTAPGA